MLSLGLGHFWTEASNSEVHEHFARTVEISRTKKVGCWMMFLRYLVHLVQKVRANFSRNWRNPTLPRLGVYAACLCEFALIAKLKRMVKARFSRKDSSHQGNPKDVTTTYCVYIYSIYRFIYHYVTISIICALYFVSRI